MNQQTDTNEALLARARGGDREAVDVLIRQYAGMVYGIALRQTRDAQTAADVSQAVFMVLVRRVGSLRSARALPSWLLQTTRYAAKEAHRAAARRSHHEHRAARVEQIMETTASEANDPKLAMLDDAIASLRQADRDVVLMRYLQGRDVRVKGTRGIFSNFTKDYMATVPPLRSIAPSWGTTATWRTRPGPSSGLRPRA